MTCSSCVGDVTKALKAVNGAGDVEVPLAAGEATVQFDERLTTVEQLKSAVQRAGYGVVGAESGRVIKARVAAAVDRAVMEWLEYATQAGLITALQSHGAASICYRDE